MGWEAQASHKITERTAPTLLPGVHDLWLDGLYSSCASESEAFLMPHAGRHEGRCEHCPP